MLFVILLNASPCTPISASNPPVTRSPSFDRPVAPEAKSKIKPLRPINTEITLSRVISVSYTHLTLPTTVIV